MTGRQPHDLVFGPYPRKRPTETRTRRSLPAAACGRFDWNTDEVVGRPDLSRSGSEAVPGTRGAGRRVRVFGRVGPPRRRVCRDRGPLRTCVARARAAAHRRAVSGHCRPPAACRCRWSRTLTRCRVARGGGPARCAGRRCRPGALACGVPAPAAPDRRRAGPRPRAVPAR